MTKILSLSRLADAIQSIDFDTPFTLYPDGILTTSRRDHAPEVYHVEDVPGVEMEIHGPWTACLDGLSNQDGYRGPVMHASEQISEGVVSRLLDRIKDESLGAVFVIVAVEVMPTDEDPEPAPAGWTILIRDPREDES